VGGPDPVEDELHRGTIPDPRRDVLAVDAAMTTARLRIALPWPGGLPAAEERLPAAEWLVARARRGGPVKDWRAWLLDDSATGPGLLRRYPAGPCVRMAWTGERPAGSWACAAPVHLVTGLDHLRLAAPVPLPLAPEESAVLVADLNAQLVHRGFVLEDVAGRGWLCRCPDDLDCLVTEPAAAVGANLRELQPSGRDAGRIRAWVNESQMALHEHPVNLRRAANGLPAVNSVWLWGFGAVASTSRAPEAELLTDDDWLAGLWRLHGAEPGPPERLAAALETPGPTVLLGLAGLAGADGTAAWSGLERQLFEPVRAALLRGRLESVSILLGSSSFELGRDTRMHFWRRSKPLAEALQ
jgi:hypothetical protein